MQRSHRVPPLSLEPAVARPLRQGAEYRRPNHRSHHGVSSRRRGGRAAGREFGLGAWGFRRKKKKRVRMTFVWPPRRGGGPFVAQWLQTDFGRQRSTGVSGYYALLPNGLVMATFSFQVHLRCVSASGGPVPSLTGVEESVDDTCHALGARGVRAARGSCTMAQLAKETSIRVVHLGHDR